LIHQKGARELGFARAFAHLRARFPQAAHGCIKNRG
jgi:hypothetical protein